jgi:hypothetical protein
MGPQGAAELSAASVKLLERGDLDELTAHVNGLVDHQRWAELDALRTSCRLAFERGKQLWAISAHIEYRLCLEAPGSWGALMLETGAGRFALGPLPEVAASSHSWDELSPHLHATPQAAMAAHERVLRGEDLSRDRLAVTLPEVLDLPLRLEPWEPSYVVAGYHPDGMEAPVPRLPSLAHLPAAVPPAAAPARGQPDVVSAALEDLVSTWTEESNGRVAATSVPGSALQAVSALGARPTELVELEPATALAVMAWAAADGGAHGRRRGAAPGRFAAWLVLAALGGLTEQWPLRPDDVGEVAQAFRWYAWGSGEPVTGWSLRLAVEATGGSRRSGTVGAHRRGAWAVAATDAT